MAGHQRTQKPRSVLVSFITSPSVLSLVALAAGLSFFLVWLSDHPGYGKVFSPVAEAVLVFTLVGVWFETPWVLSMLAHAFLSAENVARLSESARKELRKQLHTLRAEASGDKAVIELVDTLEKTEPDFLAPYVIDCHLVIKHRPVDDTGSLILVTTEFAYTVINPGGDNALFGKPFETTMKAVDSLPADVKLFSLESFQILDAQKQSVVCKLGPEDLVTDENKQSGETKFTVRAEDPFRMGAGDTWRVYFLSRRVISYHDAFKYVAVRRCVKDMHVTYEYGELRAKYPGTAPKLWLFTQSATVLRESTFDAKTEWDLRGWLLTGNGFVLSW